MLPTPSAAAAAEASSPVSSPASSPASTAGAPESRDEGAAGPGRVRLVGVGKRFPGRRGGRRLATAGAAGEVVAVAEVHLDIASGESFAILGPSGSGKTTLLRMIAGFEEPTAGTIALGGRDVTTVPARRRNVNTVFQDYALFPHMTVEGNVGYGLRVRGVGRTERRRRVAEALELVGLDGYGDRRPAQLSGGQRQRVALARALVGRPSVLLLDEPLGALDRKLRERMQLELRALQRELGITFVIVTHDQDEALTLCDRVAVLADGRVEQVGPVRTVYERPANRFVADFVGTTNLIEGTDAAALLGRPGAVVVRPERIAITAGPDPAEPSAPGTRTVTATVVETVYAGPLTRVAAVTEAGTRIVAAVLSAGGTSDTPAHGTSVRLSWPAEAEHDVG